MKLDPIPLHFDWEEPLEPNLERWIVRSEELVQQFWDRWQAKPIEQYVACDFRYVAAALREVLDQKLQNGNLFCEWGCGFGVVTGIASLFGMEAIGIEAEPFLVSEGRKLLKESKIAAELWEGNFLPKGAERLAETQSNHASLFHNIPDAYSQHDLDLDDFGTIFAYPWPGEEHFLREVFRRYARENAILLMFRGPYHIEVYRNLAG
jgi:hypothetical protein